MKFFTKLNSKYENSIFYRYIGSAIAHPKNFFFCLKYPFYKARNVWTDKFLGYAFTEYDWINKGWQKAFGKQLSAELKTALKKDDIFYKFRFTEIKEKWGRLCLYNNGARKNSEFVLEKYELLSMCYCINCGKPVRYITRGWITYICEDCAKAEMAKEELKNCKVRIKDIPQWSSIDPKTGKDTIVNFKKVYNIDIPKIWGLKK